MRRHPRVAGRAGLAVCLAAALGPHVALANGAFPDEFSVHFPPGAPHRILVGANFGLLVSEDDGATWRYACEPWVTAGSSAALSQNSVSFYQITASGAALAQSNVVTRSEDVGCTWPQSDTSAFDQAGEFVSDMFADQNDASLVVAIVQAPNGSASYLAVSHDGGKSFPKPPVLTSSDILRTVETASSAPGVIWATAEPLNGANGPPKLLRSGDSGATWTTYLLPALAGKEPRILAVDPEDAGVVYLRVIGAATDAVVVATLAAGAITTTQSLQISGQFTAFVRATDRTLYLGTGDGRTYAIHTDGTVTPSAGPLFRCLGQRPGTSRLFACGDFANDPTPATRFSLGYSDDGGATWHKMMDFTDLLGPLLCAPVQTNCAAHWARIQIVLGIGDAGSPDSGAPDGGPADAGGSDAGHADAGAQAPPQSGGSHCGSAGAADPWPLLAAALLVVTTRRRRR